MEEKKLDEAIVESGNDSEIMVKIENVSKQYRLGMIGGTTLREALQRWWAKIRKKEDPTRKIGAKNYNKGEKFMALNGVSFEVKKGEAIGLIGHNGAGKSTLLKLITRVTAPTEGKIYLNGRVASMLEVGTGFHGELTGRENVYMNGAILGMTKKEIDAKIEDIIDFSEVREFIDTPVKRYSSGMFVKLAFSVAAHLDAEIMLMDEVLAVGDMAFQNKCINKMKEVANSGRTIIYVSHNMNTIRKLCNRCVVLNKGEIEFVGNVETGINKYFAIRNSSESEIALSKIPRQMPWSLEEKRKATLEYVRFNNKINTYLMGSKIKGVISISSKHDMDNVLFNTFILYQEMAVTCMRSKPIITLKKGERIDVPFEINLSNLAPATYILKMTLSLQNEDGGIEHLDVVADSYEFKVEQVEGFQNNLKWQTQYNGFFIGEELKLF